MGRGPPMGPDSPYMPSLPMGRMPARFNRFEAVDEDDFTPRPMPGSSSGSYGGYAGPSSKSSARRSAGLGSYEEPPFDQAAKTLHQALTHGIQHLRQLRNSFEKQVEKSGITMWAHPDVVDELWTMKLEWNGVNLAGAENNSNLQPLPEVVTYRSISKKALAALKDLEHCQRPKQDLVDALGKRLSFEVLRTTMRKLEVSRLGLEELFKAVTKDRTLMEAVLKEMQAAVSLLADLEELWMAKSTVHGKGRGRARTDKDKEGYVWAHYSSDDD